MAGVALGAFAAHALKARLSAEMLAVFETGVRYQMYHALALFAVAWGHVALAGQMVPGSGLAVRRGNPDFQWQPLRARTHGREDG